MKLIALLMMVFCIKLQAFGMVVKAECQLVNRKDQASENASKVFEKYSEIEWVELCGNPEEVVSFKGLSGFKTYENFSYREVFYINHADAEKIFMGLSVVDSKLDDTKDQEVFCIRP